MRYVSLFSGAGGFDLGLDAAGLTCVAQVEIDRTARSVLARRWPGVPKHEDVRAVGKHNLPACDVVAGGFPCQDLSVAGRRAGLQAGERSGLWWEMLRVVRELRPGVVVWENVPGLLTSDAGRDHWRVCSSLAECGYFGAWRVLDAQFFGVPQRRRRVFGVFACGRAGAGRAAEILALTQGVCRHPAAGREAGAGVAARTDGGVAGRVVHVEQRGRHGQTVEEPTTGGVAASLKNQRNGFVAYGGNMTSGERRADSALSAKGGTGRLDFETETFVLQDATGRAKGQGGIGVRHADTAYTLDTQGVQGIAHCLRAEGFDASEDGTGRGTPLVPVSLQMNFIRRERVGDTAGTIAAQPGLAQFNGVWERSGVRRLTPRECERLMGWPDVLETATVHVCNTSSTHDQLNSRANAAMQSHKWPSAVGSAARSRSLAPAWSAEPPSWPSSPLTGKPVEVVADFDSEGRRIVLGTPNGWQSPAFSVGPPSLSGRPGQLAGSAHLGVLISITSALATRSGGEGLRLSRRRSTPHPSGSSTVVLYGREIAALASGVEESINEAASLTKSITSGAGPSFQTCDSILATLCSSVIHATSGYIPEPIRNADSYALSLRWVTDHTRWRADGTEIADGPRYRMCGNGVVASVAEWIGRRLLAAHGEG